MTKVIRIVNPLSLTVYTALLAGFVIYLTIFSYQSIKYKKSGDFIMWGLISCVIGSFFLILDLFFNIETIPDARQGVLMIISTYFNVIGFICFHIFIERNKAEISLKLNAILFCLVGLAGGAYSAFALNPTEENFILPLIGYSLFGIAAFSNATLVNWRAYIATERETEPLVQTIAMAIITLGFSMGFLSSLDIGPNSLGNILQLSGLMLYLLPYINNINYMYRLPVKIQMIGIFNVAGISIFDVAWDPRLKENMDLLASAFQAMNTLLNETLFVKRPVKQIVAPKGAIMLRQFEDLMIVVVAESTNAIMASSLDRFLREFSKKIELHDKIIQGIITSKEQEEIRIKTLPLLTQTFPYLELPKDLKNPVD